ncbi:MAG: toll/interleukin-1 receptor domain-containing protein [Oscillospiraceae bacterium]|nr:toll/interleukin-1 receptor domain-containing protein [Oscillospiraceae bacterium]
MHDAFISYSTANSSEAYTVRNYLQRSGCTCWMAPDDIPAGSDYAEAIPKAITDCRVFILILSVDAQNSNWVRKELGKAIDKGKTVIPFMIRDFKLNDTFDFLLENAQWCYAYQDRNAALQKMLTAVKGHQGAYSYKPKQSAPPQQKSSAPKAAAPTPKPAANTAKKRSADPKVLSRWLYCLAMWGTFCATVCVLLGISFFLSQRTTIGNGAIAIVAIGIPIAIFLTVMLHKKDKLTVWIRSVKRGNMIQKFLLWLVLGVGIFVVLVIIGGLTYLQLVGQESFTQDNIKLLAVISGALSLGIMSGWLKKFVF